VGEAGKLLDKILVASGIQRDEPIGRVRGRFYRYHQAKVLVTYHPSYLLRTPEAKKETWLDMQMLMRDLGIPIPSSGATTGNGSVGNRPNKGSS